MAVVEKNEAVLLAQCPLCKGSTLFVVERFMSSEDRADLDAAEKKGFAVVRLTLQNAGNIGDCACTESALAKHQALKTMDAQRPRRPLLTLPGRKPASKD